MGSRQAAFREADYEGSFQALRIISLHPKFREFTYQEVSRPPPTPSHGFWCRRVGLGRREQLLGGTTGTSSPTQQVGCGGRLCVMSQAAEIRAKDVRIRGKALLAQALRSLPRRVFHATSIRPSGTEIS